MHLLHHQVPAALVEASREALQAVVLGAAVAAHGSLKTDLNIFKSINFPSLLFRRLGRSSSMHLPCHHQKHREPVAQECLSRAGEDVPVDAPLHFRGRTAGRGATGSDRVRSLVTNHSGGFFRLTPLPAIVRAPGVPPCGLAASDWQAGHV